VPVFKTNTNRVVADDPEADDLFVRVTWHGSADDRGHLRPFNGPVLPIEEYRAAVDWAVGIADQMRFPLYVVPMTGLDALRTDSLRRAVGNLTHQQRGELRQLVVATCAEIMRDCDDADVRGAAFDILSDMGVVKSDR
jgi:hypothetical protein